MRTNLECVRGDMAEWTVTVTKDELPVDLTGAKLWMTALRSVGGTQIFQRTSPATGITIDPDQESPATRGKAVAKLATTSTSELASEIVTLYYDIQVLTAGGDLWTVSYGDLVVTPDATTEIA